MLSLCARSYNAFTQCAAPTTTTMYSTVATPSGGYTQSYANPQLSYGITCGQVSSTNQFAQIQLYTVSPNTK